MNYQRSYCPKMPPFHRILCTNLLVLFVLGFLLSLPSNSLSAELRSQSEVRYLSKLIDAYGKHAIIDWILKLRNGQITVEIDGAFKDSIGQPQSSYITPRSLLNDIQKAGLSMAQFATELVEVERAKQLQARIEADKELEAELQVEADLAARAEKERRRNARRRAFLDKYGDGGNSKSSSDANTNREKKNSKRNSDPKTVVLKAGQIAAVSEAYLDEAYRYLADEDSDALQDLLDAGAVFIMVRGVRVHVLHRKVWRGRVKIRVVGTTIDLWAALASIQP